jgi:hypothetical protein
MSGFALLSVMLLSRLPRPGALAFHGPVAASLLVESYLGRLHMGSWLNDLMPAHAALSMLMPLVLFALGAGSEGRARVAWRMAVGFTLAAQFALLSYDRHDHSVKRGSRREGSALVERFRREAGDVLVVNHPYLAVLAGKRPYAHQMAMIDIFEARADPRGVREKLRERWRKLFEQKRFSMVVLADDWYVFKPELEAFYRRAPDLPLADEVLMPVTGTKIKPKWVYVPK